MAATFHARTIDINSWTILVLPPKISGALPSRGMVMVEGTIDGRPFQSPLEPDGRAGHWLGTDQTVFTDANVHVGDEVTIMLQSSEAWPEPVLPVDLIAALKQDEKIEALWHDITPMARWDWLRWINGTGNLETRRHRIDVALSKLSNGMRRPCCFNRSACTVPEVSKNGRLLEPVLAIS